jgi:hypothetical protein
LFGGVKFSIEVRVLRAKFDPTRPKCVHVGEQSQMTDVYPKTIVNHMYLDSADGMILS